MSVPSPGWQNTLLPRPDPAVRERRIAGLLFFATCCSVFLVYLLYWQSEPILAGPAAMARAFTFTLTLMGILLAHELGHFASARGNGLRITLPWFLPAPILVGTFGAIIRLEGKPRDRTVLLEMGAMGPLAGLVAVTLVMAARLLVGAPEIAGEPGPSLSRPLLWWVLSGLLTGAPAAPISTQDPMAFAAWLGCLLTAMNLLPFGQLDGGHVLHAFAPRWSGVAAWVTTAGLLVGGLVWSGWLAWVVALHVLGTRAPVEVRDARRPLTSRARWIGALAVVALLLTFTPVPT